MVGVFVSSHFPCHAPSPFGVHLGGTSGDMGSYRFHLKRVATNFLELRKYIGELEAHKRAHVRSGARRTSRKAHALLWQPRRRSSSSRPALRHLSNARGLRVGSLASQRCCSLAPFGGSPAACLALSPTYFGNSAYFLMYKNSIQDLTHLRPDVPRVCGRDGGSKELHPDRR